MKKTRLVITLILLITTANAQDLPGKILNFYSINFDYKVNKKVKLKAGQLISFNTEFYKTNFLQSKIGATIRWNRKLSSDFYYKPALIKGNTKDTWYHRFSADFTHRSKLFKLPFKNTITAEAFTPSPRKHKYRFIYTTKLSFKNKVLPLRATPYIKYQLYYYLAGDKVNYYDENGQLLATNSPDGLHRHRLGAGVRFRPVKKFYVKFYYIWQEEFNTNWSNNRQLNTYDPIRDRIINPFNNYQVWGVSLSLSLN